MRKWVYILIICMIALIWQSVDIYQSAINPKQSMEEQAIKHAKDKANLKKIETVNAYYGQETYSVVNGVNNKKEHLIIWVPSKKGDMIIKKASDGISKNKAIQILQNDRNPKKILKVTLGMEENIPLWEITYIDQQNRYSFYYLDFENGDFIKRYSL